VVVEEDHINLEVGGSSPLTVRVDREEGLTSNVVVLVEGLPAGVSAVTALKNSVDKPPPLNAGRWERYTAIEQRVTIMLVAGADALPTAMPAKIRVVVRVVSKGRLLEPVMVEEIPVMVIPRRLS
jgi:hypothetical protein